MKEVTLVGFGPGNPALLTAQAVRALEQADLVLGAQRLLQSLPGGCRAPRVAAVRREDIVCKLEEHPAWQKAAVALSGDVGMFSGAAPLLESLAKYRVNVLPGIGSAQYFAARLGRSWQGWRFVSAHGVACNIAAEAAFAPPLFVVTGGENTVQSLCAALCGAGMQDAKVTVGQRLSYPDERIDAGTAAGFAGAPGIDSLSVMLVEPQSAAASWPWASSGIPDELFLRGEAPMTKQEVRAAIAAKLRVAAADTLYDIGAGTGSVSVELALLARRGRVFAVERHAEAARLAAANAKKFGVGNVQAVTGTAPDCLAGLPAPQAVFIGGSGGRLAGILAAVRAASPAVRVCVACVTLQTLCEATGLLAGEGYCRFEVSQIQVSRSHALQSLHMLKAQNPVFLVSAEGDGT